MAVQATVSLVSNETDSQRTPHHALDAIVSCCPADGHTLWGTPIDAAQTAGEGGHLRALALGSGALYAANESETVIAVRAQDGAIRWKAQMEGVELEMTVVE
jgi:hypothetical protein